MGKSKISIPDGAPRIPKPAPIALGHTKISIPAGETARRHPEGLRPQTFLYRLEGAGAFPLSCNWLLNPVFSPNSSELAGEDSQRPEYRT